MTAAARAVLDTWVAGVNNKDLECLTGLYDPEAVLLPTFSSHTLADPEAIRAYFIKLASRDGLSVELHERTVDIHSFNDQLHTLSGIYRWQFEVDGEMLTFEARFTYVVDLSRDTPIVHHHSSQVPRML